MRSNCWKICLLTLTLAASSCFAAPAFAENGRDAVVNVTGYAEEQVKPDTAYLTIGTVSTAKEAEKARQDNNQTMREIKKSVEALGIAETDIKTMNFTLSPNYDNKGQKILSYTVNNMLQVKISDFGMIPRLITTASTSGANEIHSLYFTNEHVDALRAELINQAIRNGRQAAAAAATAAGSQLGAIKEITVNGTSPLYENNYASLTAVGASGAKAGGYTPVESGTNTIRETVSLVYYLQ